MVWAKLDDGILDHPKIAAVGPVGFALYAAGLVYCNRNLTDGFIPYGAAPRLLPTVWTDDTPPGENALPPPPGATQAPRVYRLGINCGMAGYDTDEAIDLVIDMLCRAGLWEAVPHGYIVHDFPDWNRSKAEVMAEREAKDAGRAKGFAAVDRGPDGRFAKAQVAPLEDRSAVRWTDGPADRLTTAPEPEPAPVPVPEPENQNREDQHLRAASDAPSESNGKKRSPFGIDEHQEGMLLKLWEARPEFAEGKGALSHGGFVGLMKKHGVGPVNDALEALLFDPWAADSPYAWLDMVAGQYAHNDSEVSA